MLGDEHAAGIEELAPSTSSSARFQLVVRRTAGRERSSRSARTAATCAANADAPVTTWQEPATPSACALARMRSHGLRIFLDENRGFGAARQRLETERARAGIQVEHPLGRFAARDQNVEDRLADAIGGGPRRVALRRTEATSARGAGNDPYRSEGAYSTERGSSRLKRAEWGTLTKPMAQENLVRLLLDEPLQRGRADAPAVREPKRVWSYAKLAEEAGARRVGAGGAQHRRRRAGRAAHARFGGAWRRCSSARCASARCRCRFTSCSGRSKPAPCWSTAGATAVVRRGDLADGDRRGARRGAVAQAACSPWVARGPGRSISRRCAAPSSRVPGAEAGRGLARVPVVRPGRRRAKGVAHRTRRRSTPMRPTPRGCLKLTGDDRCSRPRSWRRRMGSGSACCSRCWPGRHVPSAGQATAAHAVRRDDDLPPDGVRGVAVAVRTDGARLPRARRHQAGADRVGAPRGVGAARRCRRRREAGQRDFRRRAVARVRHDRVAALRPLESARSQREALGGRRCRHGSAHRRRRGQPVPAHEMARSRSAVRPSRRATGAGPRAGTRRFTTAGSGRAIAASSTRTGSSITAGAPTIYSRSAAAGSRPKRSSGRCSRTRRCGSARSSRATTRTGWRVPIAFVVPNVGHSPYDELAQQLMEFVKARNRAVQISARGRVRRVAAEERERSDAPLALASRGGQKP